MAKTGKETARQRRDRLARRRSGFHGNRGTDADGPKTQQKAIFVPNLGSRRFPLGAAQAPVPEWDAFLALPSTVAASVAAMKRTL